MKTCLTAFIIYCCSTLMFAQDSSKTIPQPAAVKKADNYTIQRLLIFKGDQILLEKGPNGWMTPALRSNENQSLKEGLDSLAKAIGLSIRLIKLSGLYTYKFIGLPDHKEVSYRTHYTAKYISGELVTSKQPDKMYKWVAIKNAVDSISNEALKAETSQILNYPKVLWGGSFLYTYKSGKLESIKMTENFYPLSDQ